MIRIINLELLLYLKTKEEKKNLIIDYALQEIVGSRMEIHL